MKMEKAITVHNVTIAFIISTVYSSLAGEEERQSEHELERGAHLVEGSIQESKLHNKGDASCARLDLNLDRRKRAFGREEGRVPITELNSPGIMID